MLQHAMHDNNTISNNNNKQIGLNDSRDDISLCCCAVNHYYTV